MTLIKRSDKGQALTYEEMDGNFTHLGGDGSYQFPSTDGVANQVLVTNGEGQLEFRDQLDVDFTLTDIKGSVYGQDSSLIVDSENNALIGNLTGDMIGSVFADDSTLLVDGIEGKIVGPVVGQVTPTMFKPPMLTQIEIDALTPSPGMMVYNTTTGKFQGYAEDANNDSTTAWADLH